MKVYLELYFLINYILDISLLIGTSKLLKIHVKIIRYFIGAFIGSITIILLFINISNITLLLLKIFISIIMIISTYGFEKLQITPLSIAKLLYEFQFNDLSVQFLKKEKSPNNFEEKIELLKKLERYDVIIEIIMNDKNVSKERKKLILNEIYILSPKLRQYIIYLKIKNKIK